MNRNYFQTINNQNIQKEFFQNLSNPNPTPNPIPIFPSILPNTDQLQAFKFSSNVAILNMYFIQLFVYFFKNNIDSLTMSQALETINSSNLLPLNAIAVSLLTYTCINGNSIIQSYGGMIVEYNMTSFIVLRGTQLGCEWNMDANHKLVTPSWIDPTRNSGVLVHSGFNKIYTNSYKTTAGEGHLSLRDQIVYYISLNRMPSIIIIGHSLGGGICYLLAADLSANFLNLRKITKIYPIAGPYSGNQNFIDVITSFGFSIPNYTGVFAIINTADKVPNLILRLQYKRIPSQLFCFTIPGSTEQAHLPLTYRQGLEINGPMFDKNVAANCSSCGVDCKITDTYINTICPCCRK